MRKLLVLLLGCLACSRALAIELDPPKLQVGMSFLIAGYGNGQMTVQGEPGNQLTQFTNNTWTESGQATVWLRPGKNYSVSFQGWGPWGYTMSFLAPAGFEVHIDGLPRDMYTSNPGGGDYTHYFTLRIVSSNESAPAGSFSGIQVGRAVSWTVGLGNLHGGQGAGVIRFHEADLSYSSAPASRDRLIYAAARNYGQVHSVNNGPSGQHLWQIMTAQTFVNLVDVSNGFRMDFYAQSAGTWNGSSYNISGSPWKSITVESPAGTDMKVTETEGGVSRVSHLTLPSYSSTMATGGTVTSSGGYTIHTFTSGGTFTPLAPLTVEALVVAGGGGGGGGTVGQMNAGGGGGGGVLYSSSLGVSATPYSVTVGAGGASGSNGGNSSFASLTAIGGGRGAHQSWGAPGGSGGSGGGEGTAQGGGPGSGTSGQGNPGAYGSGAPNYEGGGGGGSLYGGGGYYGGWGAEYSISGSAQRYGGGGGGGTSAGTGGPGGLGGGGSGGGSSGATGGNGTPNTGGGGGGSAQWSSTGGSGGSGIVIIRYPTSSTGSVASGNYTWRLQEGDASTWLRTTTHTSATVSGGRNETVEVRTGGTSGTIASTTRYEFQNQPWGEELYRSVADPDSAALTTTYTYHTNSGALGHYRRIASVSYPDGNWKSYAYYDDWNRRGQLYIESGPWLDSPGSVTAAGTSVGRSIAYDWSPDFGGRYRKLMHRWEYVGGAMIRKFQSVYYQPHYVNVIPNYRHHADAYPDSSNYVRTIHHFTREDALADYAGQTTVLRRPDGHFSTTMWSYGTLNPGTKVFTPVSSYPPPSHFRQVTIHGTDSYYVAGGLLTAWDGADIEDVYVHPNRSTADIIIRDWAGNIVRKETHVCTSGTSFSLVSSEDFTYDSAGRLTSSVASNGATTTNTWTNGRLTSNIGPDGTETQFTYDGLGRIATTVKKGASSAAAYLTGGYNYPAQGDITTTHTYDGADRVTQTVVSSGSLSQTSSAAFDLAGRLTSSTAPGSFVTTHSYSFGGRIVTTTVPGGATRITERHFDGQAKQVTGTGVVAEYHGYGVDGSGNRTFTARQASSTTSAVATTTTDWMGRKISFVQPGWSGSNTTQTWHYNPLGQLIKSTQPGLAATLFEYDAMGRVSRQGLDLNANDALDSASDDRITITSDAFYTWDSGASWWRGFVTSAYAGSGSGAVTTTGQQYQRLKGFASGVQAETHTYDIHGNNTIVTTSVDRAAKRVISTTDTPDSTTNAVSVAYNGLGVESRDTVGVTMRFEHDALGRQYKSIDPRTGATTTAFIAGTNLVSTVTDPASVVQATYTYDSAGRVASVKDALNKYSYTSYTSRGEVYRQWGDTTYPVEYGYDNWGRRTTMKTHRNGYWGSMPPGDPPDITMWAYHEPTGLLSSKTDALGRAVTYTYTQARQIARRTWARGVYTDYSYSSTTGELTGVNYSDSTPDLTYTYNRLGRTSTVLDATGTRSFAYNLAGTLELQHEDLPAFLGSRRLTYEYDTATGVKGRPTYFRLGTSGSPSADHVVAYGYQADGRLNAVSANATGFAAPGFTYTYAGNSHLIASTVNTGLGFTDVRTYDPQRNWLDDRETKWGATTKAKFAYTQDNLGRVTQVDRTGEMFNRYGNGTQGLKVNFGYDDRSQLTSEVAYLGGTSTVLTGRNDGPTGFAYDQIGNRTSVTHNGNAASYTTNALNQYTQRTVPGVVDVAGAANSGATVTVNGSNSGVTRHGEYFFKGHGLNNNPNPVYTTLAVSDGTTSTNLPAVLAGTPEVLEYDLDGNLTWDGRFGYQYDAENRLVYVTVRPQMQSAGHPVVNISFSYDYLGRRVRKTGTIGGYSFENRFILNGWNTVAEFWGAYNGGAFVSTYSRHHFWGLDLSGSMSGAGGVGGLLMVQEANNSYLPAYDALGNVHAMIKASDGSLAAAYEYDAFGNTLRESGTYAASNPFRFATKYTDIETGLVQYNTRYYSPSLGRFINRDTIGEAGGLNLYAYVSNRVPNAFDRLGMDEFDSPDTVEGRANLPRFVNTWGRPYATPNGQFYNANVVHYGSFDAQLPGGSRGTGFFGTAAPPPVSSASKHSQNAPGRNGGAWAEVGSQGGEDKTFTLFDSKGGNVIASGYKGESGSWVVTFPGATNSASDVDSLRATRLQQAIAIRDRYERQFAPGGTYGSVLPEHTSLRDPVSLAALAGSLSASAQAARLASVDLKGIFLDDYGGVTRYPNRANRWNRTGNGLSVLSAGFDGYSLGTAIVESDGSAALLSGANIGVDLTAAALGGPVGLGLAGGQLAVNGSLYLYTSYSNYRDYVNTLQSAALAAETLRKANQQVNLLQSSTLRPGGGP